MDRKSEKAMREMIDYVTKNSSEGADIEEMNSLLRQYAIQQLTMEGIGDVQECADDYIELAENAKSGKKKLEYLQKALELEPDNLDAARMMAEEKTKTVDEYSAALAALIEKGDKLMEEEGYFSSSSGDFWLVLETRPYMRLRSEYFTTLIECGKLRAAAAEGERMLELCENDNLGIRFGLMHIYAMLEEEDKAEKLFGKYGEYDASLLLLPMSVLYYKLNKPEKAEEYLTRLAATNKDTKKFFTAVLNGKLEQHIEAMNPYGYRPRTIDELMIAILENEFLYTNSAGFFPWANSILKSAGSKQTTKRRKK